MEQADSSTPTPRCRRAGAVLLAACLASALPAAAANYEVYPGSAFYLPQMLDRSSWSFVADHASGLYHHPVGFDELTNSEEETYAGHFTNRFAMVEGDMGNGSTTGDVANLQRMTALGLTPVAAFVNRPSSNLAIWRQLIRNNAAQGAPSYEMLAPHRLDDSPLGWYDPARDYARANMLVPACIGSGVDAPVYLYVHEGAAYRQTIYDLRDWSVANGRRFNYLVSPNNSYDAELLADTQFMVRDLEDKGHEPDVYGVVLYGQRPVDLTPEKVTVSGVDQAAPTITGLAYYLIKHRDGEPGTLDLSARRSNSDHAAGVTSPVLASPSQTITLPTSGPTTWTLRFANNSPWLDYAGTLRARAFGATADWQFTFQSNGGDITAAVLSENGRPFLGTERWMPGTTREVTMTATPSGSNPGMVKLVLEALPHDMVDHALDVMSFESGTHGNTPPTLAIEARPHITREALPLGPLWFTCGDAETVSTSLTVSALSSDAVLFPASGIAFGQSGIQRWLRLTPAAGKSGEADITVTVSDGALSSSRTFHVIVDRTTVLPVVKANNTQPLEQNASWAAAKTPGIADQAVWDSTVTAANTATLGADLGVAGLRVTNPGGDVTINADSVLSLGVSGIDLGSATRDLHLNGLISLDEAATWSVASGRVIRANSGIGGPGGITKSGSGRLELLGTDSFAAPLSASAGELWKTGAGAQASTTVSNNAVLKASHSAAFGAGGLSISAANSSTGRVELSGNINVLSGKTITINARSSNTDAIISNGTNQIGGNINLSTGGSLHAISSQSGTLSLTGNASSIAGGLRTLTLRGAGNGIVTGAITDGSGTVGISKSGTGTWRLAGTHSFTGNVQVLEGALEVGAPLPDQAVTVAAGATLQGTATMGGAVTVSGIHSPGPGPAIQSCSGNLTYLSGARLVWQLAAGGPAAERINATAVEFQNASTVEVVTNPAGGLVDFSDAFWKQPHQWLIVSSPTVSGMPSLGAVSADATGKPAGPFGSWSLESTPSGLAVAWTPSAPIDAWLYAHFGAAWQDPAIAGENSDPDGDGWSNRSEWIAGTTPTDSASRLAAVLDGNAISFVRVAGRQYRVQTALRPDGPWSHHADVPAGEGPVALAIPPPSGPRRFFRVAVEFFP